MEEFEEDFSKINIQQNIPKLTFAVVLFEKNKKKN